MCIPFWNKYHSLNEFGDDAMAPSSVRARRIVLTKWEGLRNCAYEMGGRQNVENRIAQTGVFDCNECWRGHRSHKSDKRDE